MKSNIRDTLGQMFAKSPVDSEDVERLRAAVLVSHATGKCPSCGSTLVPDPLPHFCGRAYLKRATYSETVIP